MDGDRLTDKEVQNALKAAQHFKDEDVSKLEAIRDEFQDGIDQRAEVIEEKSEVMTGTKAVAAGVMLGALGFAVGGDAGLIPIAAAVGEALVLAGSALGGAGLFQMGKDVHEKVDLEKEQGREEHLVEIMDQVLEGESISLSSVEEKSVGESVTASPERAISTETSGRNI